MSTGDFSQDAYKQLREQYAAEAQNQRDEELAGVEVQGQQLGIETLPVDAPWRDKLDNWQYPDGKSSYQDGQQSPDEILQIMRDAAEEKLAEQKEGEGPDFDAMSDDEFEKFINELVSDDEPEEDDEESEEQEEGRLTNSTAWAKTKSMKTSKMTTNRSTSLKKKSVRTKKTLIWTSRTWPTASLRCVKSSRI